MEVEKDQKRQIKLDFGEHKYSTMSVDQKHAMDKKQDDLVIGKGISVSEFERASSQDEEAQQHNYEGGEPEDAKEDIDENNHSMSFEDRRTPSPKVEGELPFEKSIQHLNANARNSSFDNKKGVDSFENMIEDNVLINKPRTQTYIAPSGNEFYRALSLRNTNSIHKQDVGLPGNFYYLKTNDDKNFSGVSGDPGEESKQIKPNINEADGHEEVQLELKKGPSGPHDYSDYGGDEDSENEIGAALG